VKITPLDIRRKEFRRSMRGYTDEEVDIFLDEVADEFELVYQENIELKDKVQRLDEQIATYTQVRDALEKTLISAQIQSDEIKANARRESDLILRDAQLKARGIVSDSYSETQQVQKALVGLKRLEEEFRFKFRSLLEGYLNLLSEADIATPTAAAAGGIATEEPAAMEPVQPAAESEAAPRPEAAPQPEAVITPREEPVTAVQAGAVPETAVKAAPGSAPVSEPAWTPGSAPVVAAAAVVAPAAPPVATPSPTPAPVPAPAPQTASMPAPAPASTPTLAPEAAPAFEPAASPVMAGQQPGPVSLPKDEAPTEETDGVVSTVAAIDEVASAFTAAGAAAPAFAAVAPNAVAEMPAAVDTPAAVNAPTAVDASTVAGTPPPVQTSAAGEASGAPVPGRTPPAVPAPDTTATEEVTLETPIASPQPEHGSPGLGDSQPRFFFGRQLDDIDDTFPGEDAVKKERARDFEW
jgi:cell division initiation protein